MAERLTNIISEPLASAGGRLREMERKHKAGELDGACLLGIILLLVVGLIALFSASYADSFYSHGDPMRLIRQQAIFAGIGFFLMMFVSYIHYRIILYFHRMIFLICLVLLFLTPFIGTDNNTFATRWIRLPGIGTFQPSELMKISIIISFAMIASLEGDKVRKLRGLIYPYGVMLAVVAGLLYMQPHMSATIIIFAVAVVILFVAGMPVWIFGVGIGLGVAAVLIIMSGAIQLEQLGHVQERLINWFDPFADLQNGGWQAANSFIAIGSGGFWGLGIGQGRQKHGSLSEPANDFIFSVWCEEMGFIGAVLVILLFGFLIWRGFYIARNTRDKAGCLLAVGITGKLAIQTIVNLFVVTGLFPVTGAALPFFSYGGTALMLQLVEMGMLLNISRYMRPEARTMG